MYLSSCTQANPQKFIALAKCQALKEILGLILKCGHKAEFQEQLADAKIKTWEDKNVIQKMCGKNKWIKQFSQTFT